MLFKRREKKDKAHRWWALCSMSPYYALRKPQLEDFSLELLELDSLEEISLDFWLEELDESLEIEDSEGLLAELEEWLLLWLEDILNLLVDG